ncbi:GNAT family N-acetyltransferase [Clostridium senegalense]|uniref:GNAT family N-acetyltransferase n=1 Tax=Clostridium senegalense TaxID=1465809 RepID=A0A6M0H2T9_9CLOT|nr:GNAT family protein [Clostridium senegalense]NEU05046.1 GNAT family N-acetyltransferase [Clostridium senegalense]
MIKLEYLKEEDLEKIVEWNKNKSSDYLLQWAGPSYTYPLTINQVKNYYFNDVKKDNSNIFLYKIITVSTNELIGTIELREVDKINKIGRVCRFLIGEESIRYKGLGTQALKELLRIGFENFNFEKITLGVFDFNESAIKCYEKSGFLKEKFIKNARKAKDGYWNLYEMTVLKSKWRIMNK